MKQQRITEQQAEMKNLFKKKSELYYHIDRIESHLGNVMVRGWAVSTKISAAVSYKTAEQENTLRINEPAKKAAVQIRAEDGEGNPLEVYVERLVRTDVNAMFGAEERAESGFHILIDRAVLNTPDVWLIFSDENESRRHHLRLNAGNALERKLRARKDTQADEPDYDLWIRSQLPNARERRRQRAYSFANRPIFSVVIPLYNTPREFLKEIMDSVLKQTYTNVELCLADGSTDDGVEQYIKKHYAKEKRIRYCRLKKNRGISENTNSAIRLATGDFIVFSDHDDVLTCDAMFEMAYAVNKNPQIDVIYTDEDKVNGKGTAYFAPHFKPDFSMELLCCNNYICHLFAVRRDILEKVGMLDSAYDGAQDYDFVLRCCEKAGCIHHIPKVLYHWRTHQQSTAGNPASKQYAFEAGRRAVEAHYERVGIKASVESTAMLGRYRSRFVIQGEPLVSILIPNKDQTETLERCLNSIKEKTTYRNYEILIIENNSEEQETEAYYESLLSDACRETQESISDKRKNIFCDTTEQSDMPESIEPVKNVGVPPLRILRYEGTFNYAAIHNFAVPYARGEYLVLLNNDTEVLSENWLEEMLGLCQKPETGAVGAKLYYPDGTIQHAGVVFGLCGVASHLFVGSAGDRDGYAGRLVSVQDYSAVTAACMMTKKALWEQVGGMEEQLAVAYNDIDYCLKLRQAGYHIVYTPYAELTHYESKTRGLEDTEQKRQRLQQEADLFAKRWSEQLAAGDPFYNPNLSLTRTDCALRRS